MACHAMMMQALMVHTDPFESFVHQMKPHSGQQWSAKMMQRLLKEGQNLPEQKLDQVQDRYSMRCLPQYMGAIIESISRITEVVETEMNSVSDNPLSDVEGHIHAVGFFAFLTAGASQDYEDNWNLLQGGM